MNWINIQDEKPLCYKTGMWDGKTSDVILCYNEKKDIYFIVSCYEGTLDGSYFFECYDDSGLDVFDSITHWCYIKKP